MLAVNKIIPFLSFFPCFNLSLLHGEWVRTTDSSVFRVDVRFSTVDITMNSMTGAREIECSSSIIFVQFERMPCRCLFLLDEDRRFKARASRTVR